MEQRFGLTAEMYRAIVAVVDERTRSIRVLREDFDRLVEAQARTEAALNRLAEAQARAGEEFWKYREQSEERWARIEASMARLAEAQARTEERIARLEETVQRLAEAQARTEERIARLEETVQRLAEAQARTEERLDRLTAVLEKLSAIVERLDSQVADLRGWQLELRYQERVASYFGPVLRKARVVPFHEIEDQVEAKLSQQDVLDLLQLDLIVHGQPRRRPDLPDVWLAVEVSGVVDLGDMMRAQRRAGLLRRAGYRAIPTVAGVRATDWIKEQAYADKVLLLEDGRIYFWEEALTHILEQGEL